MLWKLSGSGLRRLKSAEQKVFAFKFDKLAKKLLRFFLINELLILNTATNVENLYKKS